MLSGSAVQFFEQEITDTLSAIKISARKERMNHLFLDGSFFTKRLWILCCYFTEYPSLFPNLTPNRERLRVAVGRLVGSAKEKLSPIRVVWRPATGVATLI